MLSSPLRWCLNSLCAALCVAALSTPVSAQDVDGALRPPVDFEKTQFSLVTIDVGDEIYMRGGHTMLEYQDLKAGTDVLFNWGLFDFNEPGFALNFFRGILTYQLGIWDYRGTVNYYKTEEHRGLWRDKINLTTAQKAALMPDLIWWSQPEHRRYAYNIWFDNCSTRIRDLLNKATSEALATRFKAAPIPQTFRTYSMVNTNTLPPIDLTLDVLLNSNVDQPLTTWSSMYLPPNLRTALLTMPAVADQGGEVPGSHLLTGAERVFDTPPAAEPVITGYALFRILVVLPVLVVAGLSLFAAGWLSERPKARRRLTRLSGILTTFWGLMAGLFGTLMVVTWAFSQHVELHHNINLLLFWPTDWLFVAFGIQMWRGRPVRLFKGRGAFVRAMLLAHMTGLALLIGVKLTGLSGQDLTAVVINMTPAAVGLFVLCYKGTQINIGTAVQKSASLQSAAADGKLSA